MFFQVLFLQKCFLPQSISLECAWTLFPPGQGVDGLLLLLLSPGVQGEVEGGADNEGAGEEDALVGQLLADIQPRAASLSLGVMLAGKGDISEVLK